VWNSDQIQTVLTAVQRDRVAAVFLLELITGIRRGQICGLRWSAIDLDAGEITIHDNRVVVGGRARDKAGSKTQNADKTPRSAGGVNDRTASESSSAAPITAPTRFCPGFGAGAVPGYAVLRIDPAVVASDDQAAPTGESVEVPEPVGMPAGAETAAVAFA
jgi:Phage integrase family